MQIKILGPLLAQHEHRCVTLTAPKPRQLLGLLAARAGEVIGISTLMEELWEENPPPTATTTIQTYVRGIRIAIAKAFGLTDVDPKQILRTHYCAYALDLDQGALDTARFECEAARGHQAWRRGDLVEASRQLCAALDIWRGPALVDIVTGPVLRAEVIRLEERRLSVLDLRIEIDLMLGRERSLLSELAELNARHPLNERFCTYLMTALYRSGRQSEALLTFTRLRQSLVNELGVEPSPRLQRDLQAILRSEVDPGAVVGAPLRPRSAS